MGSPGDAAVKAGKPAPSGGAPFATAPMLLGFGMPPFTMLVALASVPGVLAFAATAEFPSVSPRTRKQPKARLFQVAPLQPYHSSACSKIATEVAAYSHVHFRRYCARRGSGCCLSF